MSNRGSAVSFLTNVHLVYIGWVDQWPRMHCNSSMPLPVVALTYQLSGRHHGIVSIVYAYKVSR